jgi:hypothetical protein
VLAAAVAGVVWLAQRAGLPRAPGEGGSGELPGPGAPAAARRTQAAAAPPSAAWVRRLLPEARKLLAGKGTPAGGDAAPAGPRLVILSLSRIGATARVAVGEAEALGEALAGAAEALRQGTTEDERRAGRLKLDLLSELSPEGRFDGEGRARLEAGLDGLYLPAADLWLTPEEMTSRGLVDSQGDLQSGRLRRYLQEAGRRGRPLAGNPGRAGEPYRRARFASWIEGPGAGPAELYRGNPAPAVEADSLLAAARAGGGYLLGHQRPDGSFDYSYRADRDQAAKSYNLLRHAGACYALFELFGATGDGRFRHGAERGLDWLLAGHARPPRPEHAAAGFEAIVSPGEEAKLGGAALAALALLQGQQVTGDASRLPRLRRLALFLLHQQEESGRFESKYFYGAPDPRPFDSIYYPGEALLALVRLGQVDADPRWLAAARRGADWLIEVRDRGKATADLPHDHWLLMALNELHPATGDGRYLAQAQRIAGAIVGALRRDAPYPDWVGTVYTPPRSTPVATRAEALVAMHHLASRNGIDPAPYRRALLAMAAFQLRCQVVPENALYLPRPDRALGGFRRSLTHWEVRIDYVQHNVSALLGLRQILLAN